MPTQPRALAPLTARIAPHRRARARLLAAAAGLALTPHAHAQLGGHAVLVEGLGNGARFGSAVAIDGDLAVVGAPNASVSANANRGRAFVYRWTGSDWVREATLDPSDGAAGDLFGSGVALSGNTIIIGAPGRQSSRGGAYVFTRSGSSWTQTARLVASDGAAGDQFGRRVALRNDTLIAGAHLADIAGRADQGAAYVFQRSAGSFAQQAKLVASTGLAGDNFGFSVDLGVGGVIVGAPLTDLTAGPSDNQGAAFIYTRSGAAWAQRTRLTAPAPALGDQFGRSVAIDASRCVVGAFRAEVPAANGGTATDGGAAFVFSGALADWSPLATLTSPDAVSNDLFGSFVDIEGDLVAVTATGFDIALSRGPGATASDAGAAYIFTRSGSGYTNTARLSAVAPENADQYGTGVALSGNGIIVGISGDDAGGFTDMGSAMIQFRSGDRWQIGDQQLFGRSGSVAFFGSSVASAGDLLVVGAPTETVNTLANAGAVYTFRRRNGAWFFQQRILPASSAASSYFGYAVATDGQTIVIGEPFRPSQTSFSAGRIHILREAFGLWQLGASYGASLTPPFVAEAQLGYSVAVDGNTVVAGAPGRTDFGANAGGFFIFSRTGGTWEPGSISVNGPLFGPNDPSQGDLVGESVAVSGARLLVGARGVDLPNTGNAGQTFQYTLQQGNWAYRNALNNEPTTNGLFGGAVALRGNTAIIADIGTGSGNGRLRAFTFDAESNATATPIASFPANGLNFIALDEDLFSVNLFANPDRLVLMYRRLATGAWTEILRDTFGSNETKPTALRAETLAVGISNLKDPASPTLDPAAGGVTLRDVIDAGAGSFVRITDFGSTFNFPSLPNALSSAGPGGRVIAGSRDFQSLAAVDTRPYNGVTVESRLSIATPQPTRIDLGPGTRLAAPGDVSIFGSASGNDAEIASGTRLITGPRATLTAVSGARLSLVAPSITLAGLTRAEPDAVITIGGPAALNGPVQLLTGSALTAAGDLSIAGALSADNADIAAPLIALENPAVFSGSGTFLGALANRGRAFIAGPTTVLGDLLNDTGGAISVQSGTLVIAGSVVNLGSITGSFCCRGDQGLSTDADFVLGEEAALDLTNAALRVGGSFDAAATNPAAFQMADAALELISPGARTLEVMSADVGSSSLGFVPGRDASFPLGALRIAPGAQITLTDARDNDQRGHLIPEAVYTRHLAVEPGATLITAGLRIYTTTADIRGSVDDPRNIIITPGLCTADLTRDGLADLADYFLFLNWWDAADPRADLDTSGENDLADFFLFFDAFAAGC